MDNRRQFQRVLFKHNATLQVNEQQWSTQIIDLSLHGFSCTVPSEFPLQLDQAITLSLTLDPQHEIRMEARLVRKQQASLGMKCTLIDIDSISELRRLVQLNLADDALLDRDIEQLAQSPN
jgi:c-di-GMP-binding flagellar brake protein YcgR